MIFTFYSNTHVCMYIHIYASTYLHSYIRTRACALRWYVRHTQKLKNIKIILNTKWKYTHICIHISVCACVCQRLFKLWNNLFLLRNFYYWFPVAVIFASLLFFFYISLRCVVVALPVRVWYEKLQINSASCVCVCVCMAKLFMKRVCTYVIHTHVHKLWYRKFWSSFTCIYIFTYVHNGSVSRFCCNQHMYL